MTTKSEDENESGPVSQDVIQSTKMEASDSQDQDVHAEENQKTTDKTATGEI